MIKIKVGDIELDMVSNWDELSWEKYLEILKLENNKSKYLSNLLYTQKFIAILCGVDETILDDLEIEQFNTLEQIIIDGFDVGDLQDHTITADHFVINGITYAYYNQNTINKITLGEQSWIETMKSRNSDNYDVILYELAVLIRPANKIITKEGREMWKMDKFNPEDVELRAEILKKHLSIKDMLKINNFFLSSVPL